MEIKFFNIAVEKSDAKKGYIWGLKSYTNNTCSYKILIIEIFEEWLVVYIAWLCLSTIKAIYMMKTIDTSTKSTYLNKCCPYISNKIKSWPKLNKI